MKSIESVLFYIFAILLNIETPFFTFIFCFGSISFLVQNWPMVRIAVVWWAGEWWVRGARCGGQDLVGSLSPPQPWHVSHHRLGLWCTCDLSTLCFVKWCTISCQNILLQDNCWTNKLVWVKSSSFAYCYSRSHDSFCIVIRTFMECLWKWNQAASAAINVNYQHNLLDSFVTEAACRSLVQVAGQWGVVLAPRDEVDQWGAGAQIWGECVGAPTLPRWTRGLPPVDLERWKSHLRDLLAFAALHFHQEFKFIMVRINFF